MVVLQIATYVLFAIFVVAFTAKLLKYAKMPMQLRWELYPLAG